MVQCKGLDQALADSGMVSRPSVAQGSACLAPVEEGAELRSSVPSLACKGGRSHEQCTRAARCIDLPQLTVSSASPPRLCSGDALRAGVAPPALSGESCEVAPSHGKAPESRSVGSESTESCCAGAGELSAVPDPVCPPPPSEGGATSITSVAARLLQQPVPPTVPRTARAKSKPAGCIRPLVRAADARRGSDDPVMEQRASRRS